MLPTSGLNTVVAMSAFDYLSPLNSRLLEPWDLALIDPACNPLQSPFTPNRPERRCQYLINHLVSCSPERMAHRSLSRWLPPAVWGYLIGCGLYHCFTNAAFRTIQMAFLSTVSRWTTMGLTGFPMCILVKHMGRVADIRSWVGWDTAAPVPFGLQVT